MQYLSLDQSFVDAVRAGGPDANGQPAERAVSDGADIPCRSCLRCVPDGAAYLILAARPFPALQPYAECGPIFLCAEACTPWQDPGVPPVLKTSRDFLIKGYTEDHRIRYGTGAIVLQTQLEQEIAARFDSRDVAFVDIRSARNNCFLTRVVRTGETAPDIG